MNANELADELESCDEYEMVEFVRRTKVSTTLRQQQAEIEALKKLVSEMKYEKSSGVYEMNNEPVAWMCQDNVTDEWEFSSMKHCHKCEPLYTGFKEITDEVIEQLAKQFGVVGLHEDAGLYEFARAILRKAQEK